jgi:hypothetical protein
MSPSVYYMARSDIDCKVVALPQMLTVLLIAHIWGGSWGVMVKTPVRRYLDALQHVSFIFCIYFYGTKNCHKVKECLYNPLNVSLTLKSAL